MLSPMTRIARVDPLGGEGDAARQPAAGKRHQKRGEVWPRLQHLERDRPLPRDHGRVVEGGDGHEPLLLGQPGGLALGLVLAAPGDAGLGAQRLDPADLGPGHQLGHADHGAQPARPGGPGHAAPVIAGGAAGDARHVLRQAHHRVDRATQLEGADGLGDLELEQHLDPGHPREMRRGHHGRRVRPPGDAPARGIDVRQAESRPVLAPAACRHAAPARSGSRSARAGRRINPSPWPASLHAAAIKSPDPRIVLR